MMATFTGNNFPRHLQKTMLWAALIFAIVIKCCLLYFYALVDGDKGLQAVAAINIVNGNGYTVPEYDLLTHQVTNIPLIEWPPLYSCLLAPLLYITNFNVEWSCFLLDALGGISLLIFLWLLLRKIGFPVWLQALIIIYKGAELNATSLVSFPTDTWAAALVIAAIYFLMCSVERPSFRSVLAFAFINVLPFYFRYMYLPIVFVMPILFAWMHFKSHEYRKYIYTIFTVTLLAVGGLLFYNWIQSDEAVFIISKQRGFYPETLLAAAPIFWASFINVDFYCMQVSVHSAVSYQTFQYVLKFTSAIILALIIIQYFRSLKDILRQSTLLNKFFLYGGVLSLSILSAMIFLSLVHSPYSVYDSTKFWTYVMEERYFAVPSLVIVIVACWYLFLSDKKPTFFQKLCRILFLLIVAVEVSHAIYIIFKKSNEDPQQYSVYIYEMEKRKEMLSNILSEERKNGSEIVLVSDQYGYIMQGFLEGIQVSRNLGALEKDLHFAKPTTVLFAVPSERKDHFANVIRKHNFQLIPVSENYYLYKTSFTPE